MEKKNIKGKKGGGAHRNQSQDWTTPPSMPRGWGRCMPAPALTWEGRRESSCPRPVTACFQSVVPGTAELAPAAERLWRACREVRPARLWLTAAASNREASPLPVSRSREKRQKSRPPSHDWQRLPMGAWISFPYHLRRWLTEAASEAFFAPQ